ncbi:MAG: PhoH family protein, partial [Candidatus Heimdallarchaeota archaeon]|nr:PhoH family protein [Candidatus Heimdallarchaeota archaeon]
MTQIEKIINLEGIDLISLLGFNDVNIKPLEERFTSSITFRGDTVYLKGVQEELDSAEKVIKEMIYVLNTSGKLERSDVETIIDLTFQGKEIVSGKEIDNIILYSKKDVIKAKTPTQIEYAESVKKNDICFAIGPAGTGKTYLAVASAVSAL